MLYGAVRDKRPQNILELGTGPGYSTVWLLLACEENQQGHVWSVDLQPPQPPVWEMVACPTTRLTLIDHHANDKRILQQLPKQFELVFHDANHQPAMVLSEFELYAPFVPVGGHMVVHDILYVPKLGEAVLEYFEREPGVWDYQAITMGCGVGIARRLEAPPKKKLGDVKKHARTR